MMRLKLVAVAASSDGVLGGGGGVGTAGTVGTVGGLEQEGGAWRE